MFDCFWLALFSDPCIDAAKCSEYPILSVLDQVAPRIPLRMQIPGITDNTKKKVNSMRRKLSCSPSPW